MPEPSATACQREPHFTTLGVETRRWPAVVWPGRTFRTYWGAMDEETANRLIDLQAEITALRGAVRMLLHNAYNADESALAIVREKAFQLDRFKGDYSESNDRSMRYRDGVREAVASLLDRFQPDDDEASRLANPAPVRSKPGDQGT